MAPARAPNEPMPRSDLYTAIRNGQVAESQAERQSNDARASRTPAATEGRGGFALDTKTGTARDLGAYGRYLEDDARRFRYDPDEDDYVDDITGERRSSVGMSYVRNAPTFEGRGLRNLLRAGFGEGALSVYDTIADAIAPDFSVGVTAEGNPDLYTPALQGFARLLGDSEDEATQFAAGQAPKLRSVFEVVGGLESFPGAINRIGVGEAGPWDWLDAALTVAPGPIGKGIKRFAVDPLRRAAGRVSRAFGSAPLVDATDALDITRDELMQSLSVGRLRDTPAAPVSARGVHYSRIEDLARTDPSFYGTGHIGSERQMVRSEKLPDRTYFYTEGADGIPINPEEAVAQRAPYQYEADLQGLYDVNADPEGLVALANRYNPEGTAIPDLERLIQQYGYRGYISDYAPSWAPQSRRAAAMFEPVDVRRTP